MLEKLFEQVAVPLALLERGVIHDANPAFMDLLGLAPASLLGRPLGLVLNRQADLPALPLTGTVTFSCQINADGERRSVWASVTALDAGVTHALTLRDITQELANQREVSSQREFLRKVIDTVPGFVFVKDLNSRFLLANSALARAYATTPDAIVGKSDADFNSNTDELEHFRADDREVIATRQPKLILCEKVTLASGDVRWLTTVKVPIIDEAGRCTSLLAVATDITDLREVQETQARFQERMLEAQKLESLGVLAGGIAHDFNNLLLAILGSADAALVQLASDSPAYSSTQRIRIAAVRAAELTNQLLAYSGKGRFVVETVDLTAVVRDMAELLEVTTGHRAELSYAFAKSIPGVTADVAQLRQVVMNLITNAVEAIGDGPGKVTLRTGFRNLTESDPACADASLEPGEYVFLSVSDTGVGMDAATQARIFEPFFTTKFTGRGLGLAAVLGIVRGHQGSMRVESERGVGSTFTIFLPASDQPARLSSRRAPALTPLPAEGSKTVLVIDDEDLICFTTRQLLELCGFQVYTASEGREAIEIFRQHADQIDLVILDLTMPLMTSEEVLTALHAIRADIRVVLMSGYDEAEMHARVGRFPISAFLQKPFTLDQLTKTVNGALGS